jgi:hypothetical protein
MSTRIFTGPHQHLSIDRPLLRKLGLSSTTALPHGHEVELGTVKVGAARVKVFCTAMPAMFWRFEIRRPGVLLVVHETNSGSLTTYWPQAVEIAQRLKGGTR